MKAMKIIKIIPTAIISGLILTAGAYAQDLDVTMDVVKDSDAENITHSLMNEIELPDSDTMEAGMQVRMDDMTENDGMMDDGSDHSSRMHDDEYDAMDDSSHHMRGETTDMIEDSHQMQDDANDMMDESHQMQDDANDMMDESHQMQDDAKDMMDETRQMQDDAADVVHDMGSMM